MVALAPNAWFTVKDAKVVVVPIGTRITKDGREVMRYAKSGIRVDMADGSWWFNYFKTGSWTSHTPKMPVKSGPWWSDVVQSGEDTKGYSPVALRSEYAGRPQLLLALREGVSLAMEKEAERRAG